ncbi:MAG: TerB family tellurite resistance protein [Deltaproteobacteria bacterium]|nr:TerB family tellurite resistance protein [Deltaproteobacteria bacterium]
MKVRDRIFVLADLMLGAIYADATMTGEEEGAVRELLAKLLLVKPDTLPPEVDAHLKSFSLLTFDIDKSAQDFLADPPMKKRRLLELLAHLVDRDGTDLREDEYLRDLAHCLQMKPEEYADLVLEFDVEKLRESFEEVRMSWVPDDPSSIAKKEEPPRWRQSQRPPTS